jgi:hypothetical protein
MMHRGCIQTLTGKASDAIAMIPSGIAAWQSSGSIVFVPWYVAHMARAHAELGRFDEAWRHMAEPLTAIETTGETWCESDIRRIAGEIALLAPESDISKAETHFERALAIAREQQAKSWELRAATNLARLWRDRGERARARGLLAGVYDWFAEASKRLIYDKPKYCSMSSADSLVTCRDFPMNASRGRPLTRHRWPSSRLLFARCALTLLMFILFANLIGLNPFAFTVDKQYLYRVNKQSLDLEGGVPTFGPGRALGLHPPPPAQGS